MNTKQLRAEFEAWWKDRQPAVSIKEDAFAAYQAGRAALKAQNADAGLDVEAVLRLFLTGDGFIAECDIPHIVAALQSQDAEDGERLDWLLRQLPGDAIRYCVGVIADTADIDEFREAIDHARRIEGDGE